MLRSPDHGAAHLKAVQSLCDDEEFTIEWLSPYALQRNLVKCVRNHPKYDDLLNYLLDVCGTWNLRLIGLSVRPAGTVNCCSFYEATTFGL